MKSFRSLSLAVATAALLIPFAAQAETSSGFYLAGDAIMPFQRNADSQISGLAKSEIEYMTGWGLSGSAGYGWGNGLRTEIELAYRNSTINKVDPSVLADAGGIHNLALMGNALYDFETGTRFTPYVGFGIGGSRVDADNMRHIAVNSVLDDQEIAFAYQAIAGFSLKLEGNWSFTADYRYFTTPDLDFKTSTGTKAETENASHNIVMGIRYQFNQPKAAAKPIQTPVAETAKAPIPKLPQASAPVMAPVPQSYVVFFDFDRSVLTPEAKRIIASAAEDYKAGKYVRLVVTGHTDTSGAKSYNQKLSERRAKAVKDEMVRLGIPVDSVAADGVGENSLMVPTTDGVREAQNRRAEIVLEK